MTRRRVLRLFGLLLPAAVSLLFGYLALRDVDLDRFADGLRQTDPVRLTLALLVLAAAVILRAIRWRLLFAPGTRPALAPVVRGVLVGYLFDCVVVARAGDAARIVLLHRETGISRAQGLGTALVERLADVLVLIAMLFAAAPFLPHVSWLPRALAVAGAALVGAALLGLAFRNADSRGRRGLLALLGRVRLVSGERAERIAANLALGLESLRRPGAAALALGLTLAAWLVTALAFALVVTSFDLGVGFGAGLLVLVTVSLASILPSLPASIGVFEAATLLALSAYGVDDSSALACAVVLHALNVVPYVIAGSVVLQLHVAASGRALDLR